MHVIMSMIPICVLLVRFLLTLVNLRAAQTPLGNLDASELLVYGALVKILLGSRVLLGRTVEVRTPGFG